MQHQHGVGWVALVAGLAAVATPAAQEPLARFTSGVQLVEVYATAIDAGGELVTDLERGDFLIREDGRPQEVAAFVAGEFPLTVALAIDRSWSMAGEPLRLAREAARTFLRGLRPSDRSLVLAISSEPEVVAPLTMSRQEQMAAVAALDPWSTTSLHDAIVAALDRLEGEPGRQALVVISDGDDRYSRASAADVIDRARHGQALVYPIAIGRTRPPLLAELAVVTGGRSFLIRDARALEPTLDTIAAELRHQYLLGYVPEVREDDSRGMWRAIEVTVPGRPDLRVRARDGYRTR